MPQVVPPPQTIVVFGASGDLSRRKIIPALYNLARDGLLPERYAVVGYAPNPWDTSDFIDFARQSVAGFSRSSLQEDAWARFAGHLHYLAGGFDTPGCLLPLEAQLAEFDAALGTAGRRLLFCAIPASIVPTLITRLGECGPQAGHRVVLEKPFGRDLASAQRLNAAVHTVYDESQVFREYEAGQWSTAAAHFIAPRQWLVETGAPTARIGDIMTRAVYTVAADATMAEIAKAMTKGRFGSAVVVDGSDRLAGIVTERDVLRAASSGADMTTATAAGWMTADPVTATYDMDIAEAAELVGARGFRHLPVRDGDRVAGIVSQRDVLRARIHAHRPPQPPGAAG